MKSSKIPKMHVLTVILKCQKASLQWPFPLTFSITHARWTPLTPTPQSNIHLQSHSFALKHMELFLHQLPKNMQRQKVWKKQGVGDASFWASYPGSGQRFKAIITVSMKLQWFKFLKTVSRAWLFTVHFTILFITYMTQSNRKLMRW